ncbi:hypothetical protein [Micrococcus sp.]|uniref:hypothetical protein n=1 Tax=Micrococcus sp. TaxID=1271 RepID=UPI002A91D4A5|nr:hypothetical protein [Micrococcus sp.]MDY6054680.1 hypothetical protein [Micrococcus sp.]
MRARRILLGTALASLLLSTGCASVQTQLTVEENGSGVREMGVVVTSDSLAEQGVKPADVEASVKKHLPEELSYTGMTTQTEDGTESVVLRFRLEYDSLEDYETKVESLLQDSGVDRDATIVQTRSDSDLVQGVQVRENFTSDELLGWVTDGLESDGVIDESDIQRDTPQAEDTVTVGGKEYEAGHGALNVQDVKDYGFGRAVLRLSPAGEDRYTADLELSGQRESNKVTRERVEKYFADRLPEGASLEPASQGSGRGYRVALGEGTLPELAERLQKVTGDDVHLERTSRPAQGDPLAVEEVLSYRMPATELLSPRAGDYAVQVSLGGGEGYSDPSSTGPEGELTSTRRLDLARSQQLVTFHGLDDVEVAATYGVAAEAADDAVRERLREALRPAQGELSEEEKDGELQFTARFRGAPEQVTQQIQDYTGLPARIDVEEIEGGLRPRSQVQVNVSALDTKLREGESTQHGQTVQRPAGASIEEDDVLFGRLEGDQVVSTNSSGVVFTVRTVSLGWWIALGAAALVVLALVACAFIFRRRIAAGLSGAWGHRGQVIERARTTAGSVASAGAAASAAAGASWAAARSGVEGVEDGPVDGEFHESQIR